MAALPAHVSWRQSDVKRLKRDLQHRLWWDNTPLDLFFNSTDYHHGLLERIHWEDFAETKIPFISCQDLAVFKVFFDRTMDWADLEATNEAGTLDSKFVTDVIHKYLGNEEPQLARLAEILEKGPN